MKVKNRHAERDRDRHARQHQRDQEPEDEDAGHRVAPATTLSRRLHVDSLDVGVVVMRQFAGLVIVNGDLQEAETTSGRASGSQR